MTVFNFEILDANQNKISNVDVNMIIEDPEIEVKPLIKKIL